LESSIYLTHEGKLGL